MKEIKLGGKKRLGLVALVDDDDYELVKGYRWCVNHGYVVTNIRKSDGKQTQLSMHRLILGLTDTKIYTDHKDHNKLDNRRENLRACTGSKNKMNGKKYKQYGGKKCSSIYKGVFWFKRDNNWGAQIKANGKKKHLGYFTDEVEAAKAYDTAAIELFGNYKLLNFAGNRTPHK